jgi:UDP-N-acetylmuramoyl-L-alanyl-D-glutamate--2,6-diaminopimelate ligase
MWTMQLPGKRSPVSPSTIAKLRREQSSVHFRARPSTVKISFDEAIAAGAIAIVARPEAKVSGAVHIADTVPRRAIRAALAAKYFRPFPQHIAAVTGTNGKTSTAELTRQLWRMAGHHAASIGTLGITTASDQAKTGLTTPDIVTFLSNMSGLSREGVTHAIFEASSHGLSQYRSEGVPVSVAAFTNLSRDHLDYHGTMEDYFEAKMRLFDEVVDENGTAVIWADDDIWSDKVVERVKKREIRLITVGEKGKGIQLLSRQPTQLGQTLELRIQGDVTKVKLPLIGAYQAANVLVAAGIVMASGGDVEHVLAHMARLQPVRGRLERAVITKSGAPGLCGLCPYPRWFESRHRRTAAAHQRQAYHRVSAQAGTETKASDPKWALLPLPIPTSYHRHRRQSA